jgi:hypothetical protein
MKKITKLPNGGILYEYWDGAKFWYLNDDLNIFHREDGPAVEYSNGDKIWYMNNKCHREDGPAVECFDGEKFWYWNNIRIDCSNQEEFERLLKLKAFW